MPTITTLLIANRGEIAVRIARTAHRMGMATVGVYSETDANALHVDSVDLAVALGGTTAPESYLRGDALIAAALRAGADAVHPGYGFLAESADFAQAVLDAGLVWVGPTPDQIRLLGDKIAAKRAAIDAGVPTTGVVDAAPGAVPADVPLPALVKAAAGGGGRGMRIVRTRDELPAAIDAAAREARAAFGDGTVFIEPYLDHGRHIEVQIIGDAHGSVIHLGERDCSIQRRNQKIIEEAPAPGLDDETRIRLTDGAVALARATGYRNAGTVEFLVGADGTISFLEVNTRLQVEHPVTEAVTGLDLVELQLRVAAGEPLPITQDAIAFSGHAIEARLVAEDPAAGWLPSTGTVSSFHLSDAVRVDSGVRTGSVVSPHYDSLLAKVVAHGSGRAEAARMLARALRTSRVTGVRTNVDMLDAVLTEPDFLSGALSTAYLDDHPACVDGRVFDGDDLTALLLGAVFDAEQHNRAGDPVTGFAPSGWRNLRTRGQRQTWECGDESHHVEYVLDGDRADVLVGPWPEPTEDGSMAADERRRLSVRLLQRTATTQVLEIDGVRRRVAIARDGDTVHTHGPAGSLSWVRPPRFADHSAEQAGSGPVCPLPGTVIAVHVEAGQHVADGTVLIVVEAMKMEHQITAVGDAFVEEVLFTVGDRVDSGDLLVRLRSDGEE